MTRASTPTRDGRRSRGAFSEVAARAKAPTYEVGGTVATPHGERDSGPHGNSMSSLPVPDEWLDELAARVAERLAGTVSSASPWMDRRAAAAYLDVSVARLEKDRTVPCHRWEGRVLYHRAELDEWLLAMGAR